jgi:hypothetical protein
MEGWRQTDYLTLSTFFRHVAIDALRNYQDRHSESWLVAKLSGISRKIVCPTNSLSMKKQVIILTTLYFSVCLHRLRRLA